MIDAQPTTKLNDAPPSVNAFGADQKPVTVMQALNALACSPEKLQDILDNTKGKVLGKTQIIHFIDTGGQAIYHDVHPVLITTPSIYFVVFSLKDIYEKSREEQLGYFQRKFIQRPLRSIYTFGTKNPQEEHLLFHPVAPTIFIVGTHLDQIEDEQEEFLENLHEIISTEIGNKPYREFVQYDPKSRSFWAVDNTYAGREQENEFKQYISKLRTLVKERSMEMTVNVPLPWLLLKLVMDRKGMRYCQYSELLREAHIRGYVREHAPDKDLDTMLRLFHILGLFYHALPKECDKKDSLVFIDPDCLYSATSDFLLATKEELEIKLQKVESGGIVDKNKVFLRMEDNTESIELEMQAILQSVEYNVARFGQEPDEVVLSSLYTRLEEMGSKYKLPPWERQMVASVKAKRELFVGRLVHNLVNAVKALLNDSEMKGDVHHVRKEVHKAVENVVACYKNRSVDSSSMGQFLSILSELRIIAQLSGSDNYVVPAALPKLDHPDPIDKITADPILVTMLSQTVMEVCYLPSGLFCCLISELVTGLGWNVTPKGRTHVAFTHQSIIGTVHIMEHELYIKIILQLEASHQELAQTCQIVRRSVHERIVDVYGNLYNKPTVKALVWGFQCDSHPSDETHIAILHEDDDYGCYAECLLQGCGAMQSVTPEQMVWVHGWDDNNS